MVLAASKGDKVEAIREMRQRMKSIRSLFHSGQFCTSFSIPLGLLNAVLPKDRWGRRWAGERE